VESVASLKAKIGKGQRQSLSYIAISSLRDADATWIGKALQPSGNVHTISEQIAASHHHITNVNSDPELKTTIIRSAVGYLGNGFLHGNGTLDGINGTGELSKHTITSGVGNTPAMLGNEPIRDCAVSGQSTKRSDLVLAHQARVACHVSGKDRREPPFDLVLLRFHGTPGAVPHRFCCGRGEVSSPRWEHCDAVALIEGAAKMWRGRNRAVNWNSRKLSCARD
jgi:hypothetical protein